MTKEYLAKLKEWYGVDQKEVTRFWLATFPLDEAEGLTIAEYLVTVDNMFTEFLICHEKQIKKDGSLLIKNMIVSIKEAIFYRKVNDEIVTNIDRIIQDLYLTGDTVKDYHAFAAYAQEVNYTCDFLFTVDDIIREKREQYLGVIRMYGATKADVDEDWKTFVVNNRIPEKERTEANQYIHVMTFFVGTVLFPKFEKYIEFYHEGQEMRQSLYDLLQTLWDELDPIVDRFGHRYNTYLDVVGLSGNPLIDYRRMANWVITLPGEEVEVGIETIIDPKAEADELSN